MTQNDPNVDAVKGATLIANQINDAFAMLDAFKKRYPEAGRELSLAMTNVQQGGLWLAAAMTEIQSYQGVPGTGV